MYYVIPDIHGQYEKLNKLLNKIIDHKQPDDKIVFLGDYVDRGKDSSKVIDLIHSIKDRSDVILLMGNHDIAFYNSIININNFDLSSIEWLSHNSIETLESYNINCDELKYLEIDDLLSLQTKLDIKRRFNQFLKEIYAFKESDEFKKLKEVILDCEYYYETDDFLFSHSGGLNFLKPEEHSTTQWVWSRDFQKRKFSDKTYVVGHTPTSFGDVEYLDSNILMCDTGSVYDKNKQLPFIPLNRIYLDQFDL